MLTDIKQLSQLLKDNGYKVYRDKAPLNTPYPYIVYSYISTGKKMASGRLYKKLPLYQVSLYTAGTEKDLKPIEQLFNEHRIPYTDFMGTQGDENDDMVTNFFTEIRVVSDD